MSGRTGSHILAGLQAQPPAQPPAQETAAFMTHSSVASQSCELYRSRSRHLGIQGWSGT
jgi:hypothetical protein